MLSELFDQIARIKNVSVEEIEAFVFGEEPIQPDAPSQYFQLSPVFEGDYNTPPAQDNCDVLKNKACELILTTQFFKEASYKLSEHATSEQKIIAEKYLDKATKMGFQFLKKLHEFNDLHVYLFKKDNTVYVVCRGTQGDKSIFENIAEVQPGYDTIKQGEKKMKAEILAHLKEGDKACFVGHSLGGSVASHLASIVSESEDVFNMDLVLYQSAPVSTLILDKLDENRRKHPVTIVDVRAEMDPINTIQDAAISQLHSADYARLIFPGGHCSLPLPQGDYGEPVGDEKELLAGLLDTREFTWYVSPKGRSARGDLWYRKNQSGLQKLNKLTPAVVRRLVQYLGRSAKDNSEEIEAVSALLFHPLSTGAACVVSVCKNGNIAEQTKHVQVLLNACCQGLDRVFDTFRDLVSIYFPRQREFRRLTAEELAELAKRPEAERIKDAFEDALEVSCTTHIQELTGTEHIAEEQSEEEKERDQQIFGGTVLISTGVQCCELEEDKNLPAMNA